MTYFTGNVKYETQGLLSPRKDTETVSRLNQLEFLRFVAVMHYIAYIHFDVPNLPEDNTWHWWRKNLKHWGFTQPNFFFLLSGFVLAYNYAPILTDDTRAGYSVMNFWLKRLCWLFPILFISCFLPVWSDPIEYLGSDRLYLKFLVNLGGLSAFWPPSFRTYFVNGSSWAASVGLFNYVVTMPVLLKAIHRGLSRESRIWLLIFAWPWTWFMGFVVERIDIFSDDGTTHWDWFNPIFYVATFSMGMLAGSIFVERPEGGTLDPRKLLIENFGASGLFFLNLVIMCNFPCDPMLRWHQVGSLNLIQVGMIYLYAKGKDKASGWIIGMFPFRFLGGFAYPIFMLHWPIYHFAKEITTVSIKTSFFYSLIVIVCLARFLVEIPYARFSLKKCEAWYGEGGG